MSIYVKTYLAKSTSYEVPHYVIFSNFPPLNPSSVQIFPWAPCSLVACVYVPLLMLQRTRTNHSPSISAEVENTRIYTSTPPQNIFIARSLIKYEDILFLLYMQ
jgi:hypothetical protein